MTRFTLLKHRRENHLNGVNYPILCTILCLFCSNSVYAQLQVQTTVKPSRCSADGQIIVKTTGGTPPYTYQLLNSPRPPQSVDTFNLLSPNTYTVRITDNAGASRDIVATVAGNYQEPSIQYIVNGYTVQLTPSGGRLPYRYAYSLNQTGNFTPPQYNTTFECVPIGTHTFRIYDSCDNFFSIPCTVNVPELKITTNCQQTNGRTTIAATLTGGIPPYVYTCIRDNRDTFRNSTGNFPNLVGCRFLLIAADKCQQKTSVINCNSLEGQVSCANFKNRTAAVYAIGGNPPYTFRSLDITQQNTDGQFRNLPVGNTDYYNFEVRDSCGNEQKFSVSSMNLYEIIGNTCPYSDQIIVKIKQTVPQAVTCGKGCSVFYPYRFECIDCRPVRRFVDSGLVNERSYTPFANLTPFPQGVYRFNVFNSCGDSTQIVVETKKVAPPLVFDFSCATNSIKAMTGLVGTTYVLRDTFNRVLATNTTGVFPSPYAGVFVVEAIYAGCDTARERIATWPKPRSICFALSSKTTATGACEFKWLLNASTSETTRYQLTGGPNAIDITQTNGNFKDLEPNATYFLKTDCGIDTIKTPPANLPKLTATIAVNCTGRASIKAEGGRLIRGCLQTYQDKYVLFDSAGVLLKSNFTGQFDSLNTGVSYQVKIQNPEGCYVQTVVLQAVVYQRPDLSATYGVVCATGQTTGNIRAILRGGVPPFIFQITNPSGVYAPVTTGNSTALFQNLPIGNYTLRAVDACGVSSDFATGVGNFQFKPTSRRLCDGTLLVEVPAIDSATYKWTNTEGVVVGTTRVLETKNTTAQTYSISISTPQPCNFTGSITVPSYSATGSLGIAHKLTAQYCGDSLALNPKGDTSLRYVWQWQNVPCISCRNPKIFPLATPIYYVTVTDTLTKCVIKDSVNVQIEGSFTERIPNAFTPNNDGLNDNFNVLPDNCIKTVRRLRIYSRWGNLVFDKTDVSPQRKEGWDGRVNNKQLGTDVYVFIMEIEFIDGTFKKVSGAVNLLH